MSELISNIRDSIDYIKSKTSLKPALGIVLGTGLGDMIHQLENDIKIPYEEIPHFPETTVKTHSGILHMGEIGGKDIAILAGRFHYYEGYSMQEITYPVRVLKMLGVQNLIITNISGGLNPNYEPGAIVLVTDHINLLPAHPLRGGNLEVLGLRFPDMSEVYNLEWIKRIKLNHNNEDFNLHEGVYLALQGPSLETKAEYRFLHTIGADMVGMSSVPEAIVAKHMDMKILMVSMISNVCYPPESIIKTTADEIIQNALSNSWKMVEVLQTAVNNCP